MFKILIDKEEVNKKLSAEQCSWSKLFKGD